MGRGMVALLHLLSSDVMALGCPVFALPAAFARQSPGEEGERTRDGAEVQGQVWLEGGH